MSLLEDLSFNDKKSDFDDSDVDLASLLADDDIFPKKGFGNSPKKSIASIEDDSPSKLLNKNASVTEEILAGKGGCTKLISPNKKSPKKLVTNKSKSREFGEDDFDDSTFEKNSTIISKRNKDASKEDLKYYDASLASKNLTDDSLLKAKNTIDDDDDDILKHLKVNEKQVSSSNKSSSFLDDFLNKQSPEHVEKKTSNVETESFEKSKLKESEESDILGSYTPISQKKINSDETTSSVLNRRSSLFKQVSFKDESEISPTHKNISQKSAISKPVQSAVSDLNSIVSPSKENVKKSFDIKASSSLPQTKRSDKIKSTTEDDTDWLTFFKESPKKSSKASEISKNDVADKKELPESASRLNARRRSSGAEWLGLNETKSAIENTVVKKKVHDDEDWLSTDETTSKYARPKTAEETSVKSRRQKSINASIETGWLNENFAKDGNKLSAIPKDTGVEHSLHEELPKFSNQNELTFLPDPSKKNKKKENFDYEAILFKESTHIPTKSSAPTKSNVPDHQVLSSIGENSHTTEISQESQPNLSDSYYYQTKLTQCLLEKEQLTKSCESLKVTHEERIKSIESIHKTQLAATEESFKIKESSLKTEYENKIQAVEERLKLTKNAKQQLELNYKSKINDYDDQHKKELHRLKDLHNQSIELMKQDHEEAIIRLKKLKEQEVEAVLSTQSHSRSLQHLSDQLEARAAELSSFQKKVEERSYATLLEKEAILQAKEKDLKLLQNRLQKQLDDGDDERARLQQLVLRLESRLQKSTIEGEEERWEVQQMKSKLTIQQKFMDEECKLHQHQLEKEKEKLKLSQDSLLHEQKVVLLQLAQERQQLTQEKIELSSIAKKISEDEAKLNIQKLKEESMIESQKRSLQQTENKLYFEREKIQQLSQHLEREQETFQRETQNLKDEREKVNKLQSTLKKREQEIEEMSLRISEEKEQCNLERDAALRIKNEHQSRLQHYAQQMQIVMEKERQILMEKEKLTEEKIELENKKNSILCTKCKISTELPINAHYHPVNAIEPIQTTIAPVPVMNGMSGNAQYLNRDPSLVVWYVTAQRDREFLQDELAFLQSLKSTKTLPHKKYDG